MHSVHLQRTVLALLLVLPYVAVRSELASALFPHTVSSPSVFSLSSQVAIVQPVQR